MPNVNVNILVPQGALYTATTGQSIGTDGCATCVGVIFSLQDGSRVCAHFDSAIPGTNSVQTDEIINQTRGIIEANIPGVVTNVRACTTAPLTQSTGAIWATILSLYVDATINTNVNGIYSPIGGGDNYVAGSNQVLGINGPAADNGLASIINQA